eukprot:TRINITY_DN4716_c0_g1_i1.p1 TRINITY_DN4716_c0_g1~~TRINITY_DN4716_c0_g1_i1.p1  ORF type:complete len:563 (+),score=93.44 TRINITY_DN4716_c0_g1_i1:99-1691(+)
MIQYESGGVWYFLKIFQLKGSVFPSSFALAIPAGALSALAKWLLQTQSSLAFLSDAESILLQSQAWGGFSFLVGFLIVFRTSQAYKRFWDGCTATHTMRAEWFDACSALTAFTRFSKAEMKEVMRFKHTVIRLFSMLHAASLAELEDVNSEDVSEINAFNFELLDVDGIDEASLLAVKNSSFKVELIFSWIQLLIVEHIKTGVLSIPPPILSRAFQEIANGMVAFHDAMKISYVPFPFPYAQTCDMLLIFHYCTVPVITAQWVTAPGWAFLFVFVQVFIVWSLNFIAVEIENPFGTDANDLDGHQMQREMNQQLLLLVDPTTLRTPTLVEDVATWSEDPDEEVEMSLNVSFQDIWNLIEENSVGERMALPAHTGREKGLFSHADASAEEKRERVRRSSNPDLYAFHATPFERRGQRQVWQSSESQKTSVFSQNGTTHCSRGQLAPNNGDGGGSPFVSEAFVAEGTEISGSCISSAGQRHCSLTEPIKEEHEVCDLRSPGVHVLKEKDATPAHGETQSCISSAGSSQVVYV